MLNGIPRILIVRLSAIGDVVRALPALHTLREAHPNAQIDWAVEAKSADLLVDHPALDRLLVFDRAAGLSGSARDFWRFCRRIRDSRYDVVMDFHGIFKSGCIAMASGAPDRYGFAPPRGQEGSYLAHNHRVRLASRRLNRVEENLLLCDALAPGYRRTDVAIHIPDDVQETVDAFYDEAFDGGKRTVAVHVPVDRPEKRWPAHHFSELCDLLLADGRFEVVITYGPQQRDEARQVAAKARRSPLVAPEMPDLKHYAAFVGQADLYFGCDTGPMHIACAMGTPVVAVFGGTDPAKHAPWREPYEVLYLPPGDAPGAPPDRATAPDRLARISPETAYEACVRVAFDPSRLPRYPSEGEAEGE